jgi:hypothetical protein
MTEYLLDILPGMANRNRSAVADFTPSRWLFRRR